MMNTTQQIRELSKQAAVVGCNLRTMRFIEVTKEYRKLADPCDWIVVLFGELQKVWEQPDSLCKRATADVLLNDLEELLYIE